MANGFDIWGVIASVLGLLSLFQLIAAVLNSRLPRQRLRVFDDTLEETEGLLRSVEEEGLFDDGGKYISTAKTTVANVCNRARRLRGDAFAAQTLTQEITQWWRGLSRDITVCCDDLKDVRAQVSNTSSERRKALAQRQSDLSPDNCAQPGTPPSVETLEEASGPQHLVIEETKQVTSPDDDQADLTDSTPPPEILGTSHPPSDIEDTLPSYRRQSSLPPYASSPTLSTTVFTRYTVTSADSARATRKLVRAYRRRLMVHNVPWDSQETQHPHRALSAAASARAVDRPSNAIRHWKLLEARSKSGLRPYVTVLSHEATLVASPHTVTGDSDGRGLRHT